MASNFTILSMPIISVQVSQFSIKPMFSMLNFISRSRILPQYRASIPIVRLHCLSISSSSSSPSPPSPLSESEYSSNEHPFNVSYLINTFGWPLGLAILKARYAKFETPERPDRMLTFLKRHGFTETQISRIFMKRPTLLVCYDPERTLLPKLVFLSSIGLSVTEITNAVAKEPRILKRRLENVIVPSYHLICDLVKSDEAAVRMIKRYPSLLAQELEVDNVEILLQEGVPAANIVNSLVHPLRQKVPPEIYKRIVKEVKKMGFDPCRMNFLYAIRTIMKLTKAKWEDNVQVFKRYGWSDREIALAFEIYPHFIMVSKDKFVSLMDFLVNIMGIEATAVAHFPIIIGMSIEKRVVPRCLVYKYLVEKGFYKNKIKVITLCSYVEDEFITRFLKRYESVAPEIWDLYNSPFTHLEKFQLK